jgi:hypothetical protein
MSYLYTLEKAQRNAVQNNLTDIVDPILGSDDTLSYYPYVVGQEEGMRIDQVCYNIYGNFNYIDEILTINNIINPWSIRGGDIIYFLDEGDLESLQLSPKIDQTAIINKLINPNKDTQKDPNRDPNSVTTGNGLPPTIKTKGSDDVTIDYVNKKIKIMDRFI